MATTLLMPTRFAVAKYVTGPERLMTQTDLSRRSGVSMTTINAMVQNKTSRVDLATLDALSRALGVGPGDLIVADDESAA